MSGLFGFRAVDHRVCALERRPCEMPDTSARHRYKKPLEAEVMGTVFHKVPRAAGAQSCARLVRRGAIRR